MVLVQRATLCLGLLGLCQSIRRRAKASSCAEAVQGGEDNFWSGCRCPGDQVVVGPNADCVGKSGFEKYYSKDTLAGKGCRCELKEGLVGQGDDGNVWGWDRYRRCDDTGYTPACGLCEGIGGIVDADEKSSVELAYCEVVASKEDLDLGSIVEPVWSTDFTVTRSAEILIGKKTDAACFQAFPNNDSVAPMCYKPQEVKISSDMVVARALRLDVNQAGNAWGLAGNITSVILHQYGNMWIMNQLPFGITQTVCTAPREGADLSKPPVAPLQYNWTKLLRFMGRERLHVEYGVGPQTLDHWIYGPHHAWTNPQTGIIVRLWQPFNGLQVFFPGTWQEGTDSALFSELKPDGSQSPAAAKEGGATFRIKCKADGFSEDSVPIMRSDDVTDALELASQPVGHQQSSTEDLERARTKVPRAAYKGDTFGEMSQTLNEWLMKHAPNSKECDAWTVDELQRLQMQLFVLRDPQLDGVYQDTRDSRQLPVDLAKTAREWDELNSLAQSSPELQRIHRDGHCHEAVMWYVHHLPESVKAELKDKIALPLLSRMRHELSLPVANVSMAARRVHKSYTYKVSCADCHSAVFPA